MHDTHGSPLSPLVSGEFVDRSSERAASFRMTAALKAKGYPHQFVFSEASGHVERSVEMQTMPEAFEWVWKGYKPGKD
jgi:hypothetical protein